MLHYIHVQGKEAQLFSFRNQTAQNFKSLVQSVSEGASLVISSHNRTDVFYSSKSDLSETVIKLWSLQETSLDTSMLEMVHGREACLELFFTSLVSLSSVNSWYEAYLDEFRKACSLDQNNPILKDLKLCEQYLQESNKTLARPISITNAKNVLPKKEVFQDVLKHINDFLN